MADPTSAQLSPPAGKTTGDFDAGWLTDVNPTDAIDIGADGYTEIEWPVQFAPDADGVYEFRVLWNGQVTPALVTVDITVSGLEADNAILLEDGVGEIILEDGTGLLILETVAVTPSAPSSDVTVTGYAAGVGKGGAAELASATVTAYGASVRISVGAETAVVGITSYDALTQTNDRPWIYYPPGYTERRSLITRNNEGRVKHPSWLWDHPQVQQRYQTVLVKDGAYTAYYETNNVLLAEADIIYKGGYEHPVTEAEKAAIEASGIGGTFKVNT